LTYKSKNVNGCLDQEETSCEVKENSVDDFLNAYHLFNLLA
jgi:hypothetical protein